ALDRGHRLAAGRRHRQIARLHRLTVDDHGASPAQARPAPEAGALELEIVAQDVEQRRLGIRRDLVTRPVYVQYDAHGLSPVSCELKWLTWKNSGLLSHPTRALARATGGWLVFFNVRVYTGMRIYVGMEDAPMIHTADVEVLRLKIHQLQLEHRDLDDVISQ